MNQQVKRVAEFEQREAAPELVRKPMVAVA